MKASNERFPKRLTETKKLYEGLKSRFLKKDMADCFEGLCR